MKRNAMITGASEGIGRAFARRLAADGWTLTLVARNVARLRELSSEVAGSGHTVHAADLTTEHGLAEIRGVLKEKPFQLLFNNAGITHYGAFAEVAITQHMEVLSLNCRALVELAHEFLVQASSGSTLINVSSMLAYMPQPTSAVYSASKAFVTSFSESLWYENKARGVFVMALHPGITKGTEFRRRGGGAATTAPWAMTAETVSGNAMKALKNRGSCTTICGTTNKVLATAVRMVPRQLLVRLLGRSRSRSSAMPFRT